MVAGGQCMVSELTVMVSEWSVVVREWSVVVSRLSMMVSEWFVGGQWVVSPFIAVPSYNIMH